MPAGRVLVVGRNSTLARRFRDMSAVADRCHFIAHGELDDLTPQALGGFDCVVNFAIAPEYRRNDYAVADDFDLRLAGRLRATQAQYVMLSSRAVYPRQGALNIRESQPAPGNGTSYGNNKAETERRLEEILGARLTRLRIANVVGNEYGSGRRTFMSHALGRLKAENEIVLDIAPRVRRDFMPDTYFVAVLDAVLRAPCGGALNVGSGVAVPVGDIARWLFEGYGEGRLVVSDERVHDEFVLNVGRLRSIYGIACTVEEIAAHCRRIGRELRDASPVA